MGQNIWTRLILISGSIIFADQLTKYIIKINIALYDKIIVIKNFFNITHILNPGGAFGFFASISPGVRKFLFLFVYSIVALLILWFYKKYAENFIFLSIGLALIFGGAVGNLIDRFIYGKVVDFLDFYMGTYHWPAFNIADSAISIGMGILIYHIIFKKIPDF
ncbi:MAG: signal peptidase II [Deltaproteobacteria bacterium]|jgi:signal peptidase II|nr:signal peptidase II [Deltaproteobacteria bacterium]